MHSPTWISRFTDMTRQAASYREGRVLLAGDAAHVHPPQGGQGLNTGVQDAVNLGWKLAQVVNGTSPESLLDTYHAERHPVGARVLRYTMAQVALSTPDDRHQALRDTMTELLSMDEPRRRIAAMLSGLDIHYDLGEGHPLLGRRMPDLDVQTADGPTRVFTLLHDARPVLLNLGEPGGFDISPWANRVRLVDAKHDGVWELPVLGEIAAPPAVLIRPDGHVAWAGDLTDPAAASSTCDLVRGGLAGPVEPAICSRAPTLRREWCGPAGHPGRGLSRGHDRGQSLRRWAGCRKLVWSLLRSCSRVGRCRRSWRPTTCRVPWVYELVARYRAEGEAAFEAAVSVARSAHRLRPIRRLSS